MIKKTLEHIESFLRVTGMASTYFGKCAVNDGKFVDRLRNGCDITTKTQGKVHGFMRRELMDRLISSKIVEEQKDAAHKLYSALL